MTPLKLTSILILSSLLISSCGKKKDKLDTFTVEILHPNQGDGVAMPAGSDVTVYANGEIYLIGTATSVEGTNSVITFTADETLSGDGVGLQNISNIEVHHGDSLSNIWEDFTTSSYINPAFEAKQTDDNSQTVYMHRSFYKFLENTSWVMVAGNIGGVYGTVSSCASDNTLTFDSKVVSTCTYSEGSNVCTGSSGSSITLGPVEFSPGTLQGSSVFTKGIGGGQSIIMDSETITLGGFHIIYPDTVALAGSNTNLGNVIYYFVKQ